MWNVRPHLCLLGIGMELPSSKGGVTPAYIRFMVGEVHPFGPAALPVAMIINTAALPLIAKFEGRYSGYH